MKTPLAFQSLHAFSTKERKRLALFLQSPALNSQKVYIDVLKEWEKYRGKPINRRAFYQKVLPTANYLERDWHLLMSRFQEKIDQYLVWNEIRTDQLHAAQLLLKAKRRLQRQSLFETTITKIKRLQKKRTSHQARLLFYDYELEMEYYDFIASHKRHEMTNLQVATDTLDHYFIAEKLRHACLAHSRSIANQENYKIHYLASILSDLKRRPALLEIPAIAVYQACYLAVVMEGSEGDFQHLRQVIESYQDGFPKAEIRDIYLLAINFCIKAMNASKAGFEVETLALYSSCLDNGFLLEDGHFPSSTFSNMVALGIKLNRLNWVNQFIEQQQTFLSDDHRSSLVSFNKAQLFYAQGLLEKAASSLILVDTKSPFLYLGAKSLLLRVLYEAQEWNTLDNTLDSLRVYLQRKKELGYHRLHYRLVHDFFRKLIQLKPSDKAARLSLRNEVAEADALRMKEWFYGQLDI